ncbi:hypothetical protein T439DRAFT_327038 [Meredithblackwellia eburnea MCA 4105]
MKVFSALAVVLSAGIAVSALSEPQVGGTNVDKRRIPIVPNPPPIHHGLKKVMVKREAESSESGQLEERQLSELAKDDNTIERRHSLEWWKEYFKKENGLAPGHGASWF